MEFNEEKMNLSDVGGISAEIAMEFGSNHMVEFSLEDTEKMCFENLKELAKDESPQLKCLINAMINDKEFKIILKANILETLNYKLGELIVEFEKNRRKANPKTYKEETVVLHNSIIKVLGANKEKEFAEYFSELEVFRIKEIINNSKN